MVHYKVLDMWIGVQFSIADFQNSFCIFDRKVRLVLLLCTTLVAVLNKLYPKAKTKERKKEVKDVKRVRDFFSFRLLQLTSCTKVETENREKVLPNGLRTDLGINKWILHYFFSEFLIASVACEGFSSLFLQFFVFVSFFSHLLSSAYRFW